MRFQLFAFAAAAVSLSTSSFAERLKPLFTYDDYPAEAVRNHWQGVVVTELKVGVTGSPTACRVIKSSGYQILDDKTCELLMRRAKFSPPKDKDGNPIEDIVKVPPVTWSLH